MDARYRLMVSDVWHMAKVLHLQELVDLTSVARARVEGDGEENKDSTMSTFSFVGLRHNVQQAIFLLEYQSKCIQQHQKMQKEHDALSGYLEPTNASAPRPKQGVCITNISSSCSLCFVRRR